MNYFNPLLSRSSDPSDYAPFMLNPNDLADSSASFNEKSRVKPDKGRRRKHEDLYLLHYRKVEGDKHPFTGDLHTDLEIFRNLLIDVAGYRPGQDILVPEVLLSAVAERYIKGGGFYSFNAIMRTLDSATLSPEFTLDYVLKRIRDYTPDLRSRKIRKYIFQLYIKNYPTAFRTVSRHTNQWRSDMFNFSSQFQEAISGMDLTTPIQKVVNEVDTSPLVDKLSQTAQAAAEKVDFTTTANNFAESMCSVAPKLGDAAGRSVGSGIVSGVISKFGEIFNSALTSIQAAWTATPAMFKRAIVIAGTLSIVALVAFFGYKLVMYCFPVVFGPGEEITATSDSFTAPFNSFADWFAESFAGFKFPTPFSTSTTFKAMKDSITIFTFFEKLTNAVKVISGLVKSVIDHVCVFVTGSPYFDSSKKLKAVMDRVDRLITTLDTSVYVTIDQQAQFCDDYCECVSLSDFIFKIDPALHLRLINVITEKQPLFDKYIKTVKGGECRQEPVLLWVHGEPGCSKSNSIDGVFQAVFHNLKQVHPDAFADIKEPKWHSGLVGTRSLEDKFWSNYNENWGFVMDDVFQNTEPASLSSESNLITMAKQRARFPLTSASVEDKGKLFFKSKIMACTSNYSESVLLNTVPSMYSAGAFQRRRDFIINLSHIPNVPSVEMGSIRQWDNIRFNVKIWDFQQKAHVHLFTKDGLAGLKNLVSAVTDRYISYYLAHLRMTEFSMADHMEELMNSDIPPTFPDPIAPVEIKIEDAPDVPLFAPLPKPGSTSAHHGKFLPFVEYATEAPKPPAPQPQPIYIPPPSPTTTASTTPITTSVPKEKEKSNVVTGIAIGATLNSLLPALNKWYVNFQNKAKLYKDDPLFKKQIAELDDDIDFKTPATSDMFTMPYQILKKTAAKLGVQGLWEYPWLHVYPHETLRQSNIDWDFTKRLVNTFPNDTPTVPITDLNDWLYNSNAIHVHALAYQKFLFMNKFPFDRVPVDDTCRKRYATAIILDIILRKKDESHLYDLECYDILKTAPVHKFICDTGIIPTPMPEHLIEIYFQCGYFPVNRLTELIKIANLEDDVGLRDVTARNRHPFLDPVTSHAREILACILISTTAWVALIYLIKGAIMLFIYGLQSIGVLTPAQQEFFSSDSGDVELSNRQTTVVSTIRKAAKPKAVKTAATSDHSTDLNTAAKRIMSNLILVDFNIPGTTGLATSSNFCYFINSNIMIVPRHYLARGPYASITIYPTYSASNVHQEIINWKDCITLDTLPSPVSKRLARRDLTAVYVPGIRFMKKDLQRAFPTNDELFRVQNYHGVERLGFDVTDSSPLSISRYGSHASPKLFGLTADKKTLPTNMTVLYDYFSIKGLNGGPGVCMSPYVPLESSRPYQILGFHVASDNTLCSSSFAPFTKEDYEDVVEAFGSITADLISYKPTPDTFFQSDCAPLVITEELSIKNGVKVHFTIDRKATSSPHTSLIETIVSKGIPNHPPPYPADDAPASLTRRAKELALRKLEGKKVYYDSSVFKDSRVWEGSFPSHLTAEYCIRYLTLKDVVIGIPGTRIHGTDLTKASGAPYNVHSISKKKLINKESEHSNVFIPDWYLDPSLPSFVPSSEFFANSDKPGLWIHPDVQRHFYWFHHWSRLGMTPIALFTFFLKDELRPNDRVSKEYTRYINAGQLAHQFFCRSVFGWYTDQLESDLDTSIQLGINPFSHQWGRLFKRLVSKCPNDPRFVLHDVSGWDIRYQVHYFAQYIYTFKQFFKLDMSLPLHRQFYNCIVSVYVSTLMPAVLVEDKIIFLLSQPSGGERTSTFNSFANDAEHRQIWYWFHDSTPFSLKCELGIFGDDSILTAPFNDEFNGITIGKIREIIFNHDCTESTKDENLVESQPTENAMFLSRGFREEKGLILAPLKINSIQAMTRYIMKPTDKTVPAQTSLNLHIALNEYALHGRDVFEHNLALLQPFLAYLGNEHKYPYTYDDLWPIIVDMYAGEVDASKFKLAFFNL